MKFENFTVFFNSFITALRSGPLLVFFPIAGRDPLRFVHQRDVSREISAECSSIPVFQLDLACLLGGLMLMVSSELLRLFETQQKKREDFRNPFAAFTVPFQNGRHFHK